MHLVLRDVVVFRDVIDTILDVWRRGVVLFVMFYVLYKYQFVTEEFQPVPVCSVICMFSYPYFLDRYLVPIKKYVHFLTTSVCTCLSLSSSSISTSDTIYLKLTTDGGGGGGGGWLP